MDPMMVNPWVMIGAMLGVLLPIAGLWWRMTQDTASRREARYKEATALAVEAARVDERLKSLENGDMTKLLEQKVDSLTESFNQFKESETAAHGRLETKLEGFADEAREGRRTLHQRIDGLGSGKWTS